MKLRWEVAQILSRLPGWHHVNFDVGGPAMEHTIRDRRWRSQHKFLQKR